jgi:hypothetical protein
MGYTQPVNIALSKIDIEQLHKGISTLVLTDCNFFVEK